MWGALGVSCPAEGGAQGVAWKGELESWGNASQSSVLEWNGSKGGGAKTVGGCSQSRGTLQGRGQEELKSWHWVWLEMGLGVQIPGMARVMVLPWSSV